MRYWAYFAAKLAVAGAVFYVLLAVIGGFTPDEIVPAGSSPRAVSVLNPNAPIKAKPRPLTDDEVIAQKIAPLENAGTFLAINTALMVWFLLAAGTFYVIVRDQRYRCRVCLRRLRMPVETGSRGFMLQLGRPRVEYICPYGHGTLKQEEYETSELENPEWTGSKGDMWEDLYAASKNEPDK